LKRDLKRSQESYEDSQRKLRKEVDVKTKIDEYRKKVESGKKTLEQKYTQITKIMLQIKHEIEENRSRIVRLNEQVESCTKQTTMARTAITTLSSKQSTLDASSKQLKGADLAKVKTAVDKIESELENAKNQLSIAESTCTNLKEEITKVTSVVVQYNQEWKYYTQIIQTVKKEIEENEKNVVDAEEEKEEEKKEAEEEKKEDAKEEEKKGGKEDAKEEKKEPAKPKKVKPTKSSTSNEVK
jgi:chromosome segregation ATPase